MKLYVNSEIGGVLKIYTFPNDDASQWTKRQICADFTHDAAGAACYAAFQCGLVTRHDVSLFDLQTGVCLVGDVDELDNAE